MSKKGVYSPRRRSLALLRLMISGLTIKEACFELGISYASSKMMLWEERKRYSARTNCHLVALYLKHPIQRDGESHGIE